MCGIAGFTHGVTSQPSPNILDSALDLIRHRGPNQKGAHHGERASLGAVRLKIIDLEGGDQPMRLPDRELTVAFNGEIYNHAALRVELEALGHRFESHCDTEVVLHAFAQWDLACLPRLRGMFAVAFWQEREGRLVLARDRLGIKPLYYTHHRGELHFGSELKAIWAHPEIPRRLSQQGLTYYLSLNYVPTPLTLADGIYKVFPGSYLEFRNGQTRVDSYWRNRFQPQRWSLEEARDELDRLLRASIEEHLISDVPLGIWASGGLDSSAILHYASEASRKTPKTFSISFAGRQFDESRFFRRLAEHYGTEHHEFDLHADLDLTGAIHQMAYYSDEPSADAGALPVFFLSQMTAQHVTVALSGEGADEIFGGYQTYLADRYAREARLLPAPLLRTALAFARKLPVSDEKIGFEYKLKRFLSGALMSPDEAHFFWNGTFSGSDLPGRQQTPAQLVQALADVPQRDLINRYLFIDQHYYLPDDILYKCDRMSMAHSLEVRPPFLDHRIVEFAGSLPSSLKVNGSKTKFVLRHLLQQKLPDLILKRKKEGLDIPAHDWLRGPLRPLVDDALSPQSVAASDVLPPAFVSDLLHRHNSRRENLGYHIWGLLTLHLWMRRWNVAPLPEAV